jgi:hypothetical protein
VKLIKAVEPPCPCDIKLWEFYNTQVDDHGNATLGTGSIVECDCGTEYVLNNTKLSGRFWAKRTTAKVYV